MYWSIQTKNGGNSKRMLQKRYWVIEMEVFVRKTKWRTKWPPKTAKDSIFELWSSLVDRSLSVNIGLNKGFYIPKCLNKCVDKETIWCSCNICGPRSLLKMASKMAAKIWKLICLLYFTLVSPTWTGMVALLIICYKTDAVLKLWMY